MVNTSVFSKTVVRVPECDFWSQDIFLMDMLFLVFLSIFVSFIQLLFCNLFELISKEIAKRIPNFGNFFGNWFENFFCIVLLIN